MFFVILSDIIQEKIQKNNMASLEQDIMMFEKVFFLSAVVNNENMSIPEYITGLRNKLDDGAYRQLVHLFQAAYSESEMFLLEENKRLRDSVRDMQSAAELLELTGGVLASLIDSVDSVVYISDFFTGEILDVNRNFELVHGIGKKEAKGLHCWQVVDKDARGFCEFCPHNKMLTENGNLGPPVTWEHYFARINRWLKITSRAVYWFDGRLAHMTTQFDITKEKELQSELERLAYYNRTLGLPNELKLKKDLELLEEEGASLYGLSQIICLDVASLRKVNEVYGRDAGDQLLIAIRDWLVRIKPESAKVYLIEGDCFCIALPDTSLEEAYGMAETIYRRFDVRWTLDMGARDAISMFSGVTMGIVDVYDVEVADDPVGMIGRTLDTAKTKDEIVVLNRELEQEFKRRTSTELSLKHCVRENMEGFEVHYQPIVQSATGKWCALEALCRWTSPEFGVIAPNIFIPMAEQAGLINTIGRWVIGTAIAQIKAWGLDDIADFVLNVNISAQQFTDETILDYLDEILKRYDFPGGKLALEVTESMEFHLDNNSEQIINSLREKGVRIALDDFGTGYASFGSLINLPVSLLKTERTFIDNIQNNAYQEYLLSMLVDMAYATGIRLIAEGVETQEQANLLERNGASFMQGYLFSKPLSPESMAERLSNFYQNTGEDEHRGMADVKKVSDSDAEHAMTPRTYRLLNQSIKLMLGKDLNQVLADITSLIGQNLEFDCAGIFLRNRNNDFALSYSWYNPDIKRTGENALDSLSRGICEVTKSGDVFVTSDIVSFPEEIQGCFKDAYVSSIGVIPIKSGNDILGAFCLASYQDDRIWAREEILLMHNLSLIFSCIVTRKDFVPDMIESHVDEVDLVQNLKQLLRRGDSFGCPVTVCWMKVDLSGLRKIEAGKLTEKLMNEVRSFVRKGDFICLLEEDALMLLLDACEAHQAREKITALRHRMLRVGGGDLMPVNFFFGIAQSDEKEINDAEDKARALLTLAKQRGQSGLY